MIKSFLIALILCSFVVIGQKPSAAAPAVAPVPTGNLKVLVKTFKNNTGKANVILYKDAYTFPDKPDKSYKTIWTTISNQVVEVTFENVPYGEYALAAYHDENDNHRLDLNFIGVPKEGVAISNDAHGFIMPRFKDAKVLLNSPSKSIVMNLSY